MQWMAKTAELNEIYTESLHSSEHFTVYTRLEHLVLASFSVFHETLANQ